MFFLIVTFHNSKAGCGLGFNKTRYFEKGNWTHIKQYVKMNTVGKKDGVLKVWVNGNLKVNFSKMIYRTKNSIGIDSFSVFPFFGGSGSTWVILKILFEFLKSSKFF